MSGSTTSCPECGATLRLASPPAAGARLRCRKCEHVFAVPGAKGPGPRRPARDEDVTSEKPRPHRARRTEEDEDEPRPARKKARGKQKGFPVAVVLGFLAVVALGGGLTWWALSSPKDSDDRP